MIINCFYLITFMKMAYIITIGNGKSMQKENAPKTKFKTLSPLYGLSNSFLFIQIFSYSTYNIDCDINRILPSVRDR